MYLVFCFLFFQFLSDRTITIHPVSIMASNYSDEDFVEVPETQTQQPSSSGSTQSTQVVLPTQDQSTESIEEPLVLEDNSVHRTYLITWSKAVLEIFPKRELFGGACVAAFGGGAAVQYFAVGQEPHEHGGHHYHVAMLLTKPQRWHTARKYLEDLGAKVNFSTAGSMYASAYFYATKVDQNYFHGHCASRHPTRAEIGKNLKAANANATYRQNNARKREAAQNKKEKKEKPKKLSKLDVVDIINAEDIKDDDQLLQFANSRRGETGDSRLLDFLMRLGAKGRSDILLDAQKLSTAQHNINLSRTNRLDIVKSVLRDKACTCSQQGKWLVLAIDICEKNELDYHVISRAIWESLQFGRRKHTNVLITGESNCAKTFLLDPLADIFEKNFQSPAASRYGWLDAATVQVIYLNDYRWRPLEKNGDIEWGAFLRLLEGGKVTLPRPMNAYAKHAELSKDNDVPVFMTSGGPVRYWENHPQEPQTPNHQMENKMMQERWRHFHLTHQFEEHKKIKCESCAWCFCKFINQVA